MTDENKDNRFSSKISSAIDKLQFFSFNSIKHDKYKERLKTSFISVLLYILLIYGYYHFHTSESMSRVSLACLITGIIAIIYNVIKSALSLRDEKYKVLNIIAIVLQSLFLILFVYLMFS